VRVQVSDLQSAERHQSQGPEEAGQEQLKPFLLYFLVTFEIQFCFCYYHLPLALCFATAQFFYSVR
jgi:hypothetical protein